MALIKSLVLFTLLAVLIAAPVAQAQLLGGIVGGIGGIVGGIGGIVGGIGGTVGGIVNPILGGLLRIQGIVYCTPNGNIGVNGTSTPVFPNALVQLRCGGSVVSTASTNGLGLFSIILVPENMVLSTLLSGCNLAVRTPLATCNAGLPSVGGLQSNLQFHRTTSLGQINVTNIVPNGFIFNANIN